MRVSMKPVLKLLFLLGVLLMTAPVFAGEKEPPCACMESTFDKRWQRAESVFVGSVAAIKVFDKMRIPFLDDIPVEVTFDVESPFKGVEGEETVFVLNTNLTRRTCTGHPFEVGKKYLVFAYQRADGDPAAWSAYHYPVGSFDVGGLCGGTKSLDKAADDLKKIDEAMKVPDKSLWGRLPKLPKIFHLEDAEKKKEGEGKEGEGGKEGESKASESESGGEEGEKPKH